MLTESFDYHFSYVSVQLKLCSYSCNCFLNPLLGLINFRLCLAALSALDHVKCLRAISQAMANVLLLEIPYGGHAM